MTASLNNVLSVGGPPPSGNPADNHRRLIASRHDLSNLPVYRITKAIVVVT